MRTMVRLPRRVVSDVKAWVGTRRCVGFCAAVTLACGALLAQNPVAQSRVAQTSSPTAPNARSTSSMQASRPERLIVLSDIGGDPDDTQSLIRLLLYSNEIDIRGFIATSSGGTTHPELAEWIVQAYAKVRGNLLKHAPNFASAEYLKTVIKRGRPERGMSGVGDGKDSEGSEWIIRTLEANDDRPLWITVWGCPNTLAQALFRMSKTKPAAELDRLAAKLRVYAISDQDDSGPWIRKTFPSLHYIVTPGGNFFAATWQGFTGSIEGLDNTTVSTKWIRENIQQGHGPLGAIYPDVAYGVEGDTPSYLALIPNGLNNPHHFEWGGWGGRYELYKPEPPAPDARPGRGGRGPIEPETRPIWTNAIDEYMPMKMADYGRPQPAAAKPFKDNKVTQWRWRDDIQNDFAARMDWTIKPYAQANHPPVLHLNQAGEITVRSGESVYFDAHESTDPDGDSLSFYWFHYPEAGSYKGQVTLRGPSNTPNKSFTAPQVEKPETIHIILCVTDKGSPPLTRYKRVIVTVTP